MPQIVPAVVPTALTIAGSDSSGGAGIQADLRAFNAVGAHGASVITLVTAQGTRGIRKVSPLAPDLVRAQLEAVLEDLRPRACKTGALGNAAIVEIIADVLRRKPELPLVVDPVVNPTRGRALLDDSGFSNLVRELVPLAALVVPNREESSKLAGRTVRGLEDAKRVCKTIAELGAKSVLVKGGHFTGNDAIDLLYDGVDFYEFRASRLDVPPMHGLGCTLSAMITGHLALGREVREAVRLAHRTLHRALASPKSVGEGLCILTDLASAEREERASMSAPASETRNAPSTAPRG